MSKDKKITIDEKVYVPESSAETLEDYVIVRSRDAGVFAGFLLERKGNEVVLKNSRRLWYWSGAASLSQLAIDGVGNPSDCKFPCEVPVHTILGVCEVIACTEKSKKSIAGVEVWQE